MAGLINPGILANGLGSFAAKQVTAGILKRFAKEWRIEGFREATENDYGIIKMFEVSPEWFDTLKGALNKYSSLQKITANEVLSWVQDANPILFTQICAEPAVVAWFFKGWEVGKKELLGIES
jgi:hypothetical protein